MNYLRCPVLYIGRFEDYGQSYLSYRGMRSPYSGVYERYSSLHTEYFTDTELANEIYLTIL